MKKTCKIIIFEDTLSPLVEMEFVKSFPKDGNYKVHAIEYRLKVKSTLKMKIFSEDFLVFGTLYSN